MRKTVFAIHTSLALVSPLGKLFAEILPEVRVVNVIDDSLLADVRAAGCVTSSVTRRIIGYGVLAQSAGADAIFNCCSSVGDAADMLGRTVDIPVVKIDGRMAEIAVLRGPRVGVIATLPTTLEPTVRLIENQAALLGKSVEVRRYLVEGAFDILMSGNGQKHDDMVLADIERASAENDVVVLAQGSMARLATALDGNSAVPVLSSPRLGVEALREVLRG
ncbi:MAG TPA: aspartate/glutamate racemase family protein [Bryobacteraceae bacterium]|jgi:Asp/Glu/hydantoin racemase